MSINNWRKKLKLAKKKADKKMSNKQKENIKEFREGRKNKEVVVVVIPSKSNQTKSLSNKKITSYKERYHKYLRSKEWDELRVKVLIRDKFKCVKCNFTSNLNIHHLTYDRVFNESLSDLITLCRDCHKLEHDID